MAFIYSRELFTCRATTFLSYFSRTASIIRLFFGASLLKDEAFFVITNFFIFISLPASTISYEGCYCRPSTPVCHDLSPCRRSERHSRSSLSTSCGWPDLKSLALSEFSSKTVCQSRPCPHSFWSFSTQFWRASRFLHTFWAAFRIQGWEGLRVETF